MKLAQELSYRRLAHCCFLEAHASHHRESGVLYECCAPSRTYENLLIIITPNDNKI